MRSPRPIARRELISLAPAPSAVTHIASLVVHAMPDAIDRVRDLARGLPGAEVHDTAHAAKLAIVLESAEDRLIGDAVAQLQELSGVIGVSIVSHIAEQTATLDEEHADE